MRATIVFCFGCSARDAATERIFLIIHNSRSFHPNNLKFWEKLLSTYMNNFPAGSFLYVELPPILFVGKVRKIRTTARINFLLNIYKQTDSVRCVVGVRCQAITQVKQLLAPSVLGWVTAGPRPAQRNAEREVAFFRDC